MGGRKLKEAEEHLLELNRLINESEDIKIKPSLLMIITGTDMAYVTPTNVLVVPIGCLKD